MAKRKKEVKVVLEEEKGAKNKLVEGEDILYSSGTHIEKTKVKSVSGKIATLANGVRVFKRYNLAIIREDGRTGYTILPWTEEANDKWESYTLSILHQVKRNDTRQIQAGRHMLLLLPIVVGLRLIHLFYFLLIYSKYCRIYILLI